MKFLQIKETCLYIHNLEEAKKFYHELLELPMLGYLPNKHLFLKAGSSVLLCFNPEDSKQKKSPPSHFGGGKQHFAFEVKDEDYEKSKEWILSKGIDITDEVTWESGKKSFYFQDPEFNVLEIVPQQGVWPD